MSGLIDNSMNQIKEELLGCGSFSWNIENEYMNKLILLSALLSMNAKYNVPKKYFNNLGGILFG